MADLGSIGIDEPDNDLVWTSPGFPGTVRFVSVDSVARVVRSSFLSGVAAAGALTGSVKEAGVAVPNCVVRVYERRTGYMTAQARTDAAGNFSVPNLRQSSNDHYVIALDPDGGALYNALIFDRVSPV